MAARASKPTAAQALLPNRYALIIQRCWVSFHGRAAMQLASFSRALRKPALLPITMAVATALTVAAASSRAQAPGVYGLHEVPAAATLHKHTPAPAQNKSPQARHIVI